jgi:hypothetical protein
MKPGRIIRLALAMVISMQALGVAQSTRDGVLSQPLKVLTALEDKWVEVTSPDRDFTALFPVQPEFKVYDHRGAKRLSFIAWHDGQTLMASYYDVIIPTDQVNSDYEVKLREYEEAMMMKSLREQSWKILSSRDLPGNGYQQVCFAPPTEPGGPGYYFRAKNFFRRLSADRVRVYLITFRAPTQLELFGPVAKRFYDSFRFTSMEANR